MKRTVRDEVVEALRNLGGKAKLKEIYAEVERISDREKVYKPSIRAALETNSSDSEAFNGKNDLFYSVGGIGSGVWGLRKRELIKFEEYTKEEIAGIFTVESLNKTFNILKVNNRQFDYIILAKIEDVTIDGTGVLLWKSEESQMLTDRVIVNFINHDHTTDNIYLFLSEKGNDDYKYLGLLAYIEHDNQRENPVYFKWQILDWADESNYEITDEEIVDKNFELSLIEDGCEYSTIKRKGASTKEFYSNRKIDFEYEIKENSALGKKGEELVVKYEKERLIEKGREDLAEKVCMTSDFAGNAERYDVLSFEEDGTEKYIEVKTTKTKSNGEFYISESEVKFSEEYSKQYYLYRVYDFDVKTMTAKLKIKKGAVAREKLKPMNYTCKIVGKDEAI